MEADWNGGTQRVLVADGAPLPPNAIHVFDVTVRALLPQDQESQTNGWSNLALVRSGVDGIVDAAAFAEADILIPELEIVKTATSDPVPRIGDTVRYEVTLENVGEGDFTALYPAVVWDDLVDVVDDGVLSNLAATPDVGSFDPSGPTAYRWAAPLLAGGTVTLSYTVTIADGGNANLVNTAFVSTPTAVGPQTPAEADCDDPTCAITETPLPALAVDKSVDAQTVSPGGVLTYTVTVTNTGGVDIPDADPVTVTDDLTDVLDDSAYNGDATADTGAVDVVGSTLTWTGGLAIGEVATLTYTVTVNRGAAAGATLINVVVSDPTMVAFRAGGVEPADSATTTSTVQRVAVTGSTGIWNVFLIAVVLLLLGATVMQSRRREVANRFVG